MDLIELENAVGSIADGIITLTLNRPDKRNALSMGLMQDVTRIVQELAYRDDARVMVVQGAGRSFCAGFDVSQAAEHPSNRAEWLSSRTLSGMMDTIKAAPVVKIAAIQGHAMGAGMGIALACELRYATESAVFGLPELNFGIPYSYGATHGLVRVIGLTRAAEMILTCRTVDAALALDWGLITGVMTAADTLETEVRSLAASLAQVPAVLLLSSQTFLDEAATALVPNGAKNIAATMLARRDPEATFTRTNYVRKFS